MRLLTLILARRQCGTVRTKPQPFVSSSGGYAQAMTPITRTSNEPPTMPETRRCPLCEDPIPKDRTLLLCDYCHKKSWQAEPNGRGGNLAYSDIPEMKRERGDA